MIENFRVFDEYVPFMFSGLPRLFCSKAYNAREAMVKRIDDIKNPWFEQLQSEVTLSGKGEPV